jgi:DNA-binding NarL/FixJ family response regulator
VLAGGSVIDVRLSRRFWNLLASQQGHSGQDHGLSPDEIEVLTLVARGLSNPEAAAVLGSSRRTIRSQLSSIYRKLGVSSRVEASVKAIQIGLIEL